MIDFFPEAFDLVHKELGNRLGWPLRLYFQYLGLRYQLFKKVFLLFPAKKFFYLDLLEIGFFKVIVGKALGRMGKVHRKIDESYII
jgi:hypothetical protein